MLFQKFHKMIETQYNVKVRVLHSDNSGENFSSHLQTYFREHGIIHQTTRSNTSQQKRGGQEKKLSFVGNGSSFFDRSKHAIIFAASIVNRTPFSSIGFQTPL